MASVLDMVTEIVAAHASSSKLSTEELLEEIQKVHSTLSTLEGLPGKDLSPEETRPTLTLRQAFRRDEVVCMLCGKGQMKTLTRHLRVAHGLKPGEYRKQFGIPRAQSLSARSLTEERRRIAEERGMGEILAKARAARTKKAISPAEQAARSKASPAKTAKAGGRKKTATA